MEQIYNTIIWFTIAIQVERKVKSYQSFKKKYRLIEERNQNLSFIKFIRKHHHHQERHYFFLKDVNK